MLSRERHLRHPGQRRRVLVELEDLRRVEAVPRRDLVDRGRPARTARSPSPTGCATRRGRTLIAGTAAAWSGSPSTRASGPTTSAAVRTPSALAAHDLERLEERLEPEPARSSAPGRPSAARASRPAA